MLGATGTGRQARLVFRFVLNRRHDVLLLGLLTVLCTQAHADPHAGGKSWVDGVAFEVFGGGFQRCHLNGRGVQARTCGHAARPVLQLASGPHGRFIGGGACVAALGEHHRGLQVLFIHVGQRDRGRARAVGSVPAAELGRQFGAVHHCHVVTSEGREARRRAADVQLVC